MLVRERAVSGCPRGPRAARLLHTSHSTQYTSHSTQYTAHSTQHTAHGTLNAPLLSSPLLSSHVEGIAHRHCFVLVHHNAHRLLPLPARHSAEPVNSGRADVTVPRDVTGIHNDDQGSKRLGIERSLGANRKGVKRKEEEKGRGRRKTGT